MKTDVIEISGDLRGKEAALQTVEKFIIYNSLTGKSATHIRLLAEETISMVNGIMENFKGELTLESCPAQGGNLYRIKVVAKKSPNHAQESKLMSVSTTGKNVAAKGVLGKIREAFRLSMQRSNEGTYSDRSDMIDGWYNMGITGENEPNYIDEYYMGYWSLKNYRDNVSQQKDKAPAEWDELERSILANIADDVKIGIRSNHTEVVIEKFIAD